jgi:hypothetical protein
MLRIRILCFTLMWIQIQILLLEYCKSATISLHALHGSIMSLHTCIVSVRGLPWLHFELSRPLNFDFHADPDSAFVFDLNPDPK